MDRSNDRQVVASLLRRSRRLATPALLAAAALLGPAREAAAACPDGAEMACTTADGCEGIKYCEGLRWGPCMAIEDCTAPPPNDPFGTLDVVSLDGSATGVAMYGWAIDADTFGSPIQVRVLVDGELRATLWADQYRPDVGAAYPGAGNYHGFSTALPAEAAGKHTVCVQGVNTGSTGSTKTLGCKTYQIDAKVTTTWGLSDVGRCVADPIQAIGTLPTSGASFGFTTSTSSEGLVYFFGSPHLQGITRLAFGSGQYMVVSRSGSWAYYVVNMSTQGWGGAPFGGDGVHWGDFVALRVDNDPDIGLDHAGGVQSLGTLLAVPNENHATDDPGLALEDRTHIDFFDMSSPTNPQHLGILGRDTLVSTEAGAVAMARLANDRILLISGRTESNMLDFYVSAPGQPAGWEFLDTWDESEAISGLPDGDHEFGDYQGLTLVTRCGDGALFLVGTHKAGDLWGEDWVDLYQVQLSGDHATLTKVAKRHVDCDGNCNLDAAGGAYVAPDGRLIVYATEHAADGPVINGVRSVRARQF